MTKNYGLSKNNALAGAIDLSKKIKGEVVLYQDDNGYGFSFYGDYNRPDYMVIASFLDGEELEFFMYNDNGEVVND